MRKIDIALLGIAVAALFLAGYNHLLIQDIYKRLTLLEDIVYKMADAISAINDAVQAFALKLIEFAAKLTSFQLRLWRVEQRLNATANLVLSGYP